MSDQLNLFKKNRATSANIPLAEQVRPTTIDEILGQDELLKKDSLLRTMISTDNYHSFIMWGPPGSGKTTIARLIETSTKHRFVQFSAVLSSIKDVRKVMKESEYHLPGFDGNTIIFIDEIHRFNKSQQDAFLPFVESGAITLIGATTENPSFEVIPALLSRSHVFVLNQLSDDTIEQILTRALEKLETERQLGENAILYLAAQSGGDARKALNNLEIILNNTKAHGMINKEIIKGILAKKMLFYDKGGEEHFNIISALHKSLRGSDPQAGLYWLARMLEAGEDPLYIVRRLVRFASEDIGLADPNALVQAIAVKDVAHFLGMPECNNAIAQLVVYLATAPKSNSLYIAYKKAAETAQKTGHLGVPMHIRNAPTSLMKEVGYGKNYQYDYGHSNHYYYQNYFPEEMREQIFYKPSQFGFEKDVKKRLDWWKKLRDNQDD
ncbi:MAG: replication-associated recombination protein A [Candidatus Cloacimonetes bacterium]|nr:replication-associated recombination protein A [Candidatus Cloacimonadota bacterium]